MELKRRNRNNNLKKQINEQFKNIKPKVITSSAKVEKNSFSNIMVDSLQGSESKFLCLILKIRSYLISYILNKHF